MCLNMRLASLPLHYPLSLLGDWQVFMIQLTSPIAVVLFAAIMALAPLASVIYMPAFPAMARAFDVGADQVQLTLSTYMVGMAVAQPVYGPLADRFGRKPLIVTGIVLFILASIGCMLATDIDTIIVFRFIQAFGAASGLVLAQAMIRDTYKPIDAARMLAYAGGVQAIAPAAGSVLGGIILTQLGWRAIFAFLVAAALVVIFLVVTGLPETLRHDKRQSLNVRTILKNYRHALGSRMFLSHALALGLMMGGFYAFMAGSPFILIDLLGIPESAFGWYYLLIVVGFIFGSFLAARIGRRFGSHTLIVTGGTALVLGGGAMVMFELIDVHSVAAVLGPQILYSFGGGVMMAQLIAGALMPFPGMAGTAAASLGLIQMSCAASASALVGYIYNGTALPMATTIALAGTGALALYLVTRRSNHAST